MILHLILAVLYCYSFTYSSIGGQAGDVPDRDHGVLRKAGRHRGVPSGEGDGRTQGDDQGDPPGGGRQAETD